MEVSGRKVLQLFCEQCDDNGEKLLAAGFCVDCSEFLCRDCYKHHCRARAYRNHVVQDEISMPKTKPGSTPLKPADSENKCPKHKGETIKFYCRSDGKFGCGSCIALDHYGCDKPVYIQEEYEKFETKLDKLKEQLEYQSNEIDQNSSAIKSHHSKVCQAIRFFTSKVKETFDNLYKSMITEVDKLKDDNEQEMDAIATTCLTLKNDLQSVTSDITKLHQTKQNKKLFTVMKESSEYKIKAIATKIDKMNEKKKVHVHTFVPEVQIEDLMKTLTSLGELAIVKETNRDTQTDLSITSEEDIQRQDAEVNPIQPINKPRKIVPGKCETIAAGKIKYFPFKQRQAYTIADINVKSWSDTWPSRVTGLVVLPDDHLILTDSSNVKVKYVNVTQDKLISELKLWENQIASPHDITVINDHQVAMTMPFVNQIQMLSISNRKISLGQTIKVKGECHGIVHNEGALIVTFIDPSKIEMISMSGTVLKVIDKGTNSELLFEQPKYVDLSLDQKYVYISDYGKHSVTCMTLDGEVKGIYKDEGLRFPRGLTVDRTGSVYVVGGTCYSKGNIYQISGDCSQGQELQANHHGLWYPQSIAYCHKEDKLYIGHLEGTNSINVYQLK